MRKHIFSLVMAHLSVILGGSAIADETENMFEMSFEELLEVPLVSIASGSLVSVEKAAAVASVITAEDIREMGARDLDEVLESVPGLHVSNTAVLYNPIYVFRGIHTAVNPQAHFLVNGIPITSALRSDRGSVWAGMPVKAISRIEVIRGPGSAIYGADAYAGVVNIITKSAEEVIENEVGFGVGSFDTQDLWLLKATRNANFEATVMAELFNVGEHDEIIEVDLQSLADLMDGTSASRAPGPPNVSRRGGDIRFDIRHSEWTLRLGLQDRRNVGNGAGFREALSPSSRYSSERINFDLRYLDNDVGDHWEISSTLSYLHISQENETDSFIIPPGGFLTLPGGIQIPYVDGLIGNPNVWENNYRLDTHAFYNGFKQHRIRLGFGYYYGDLYKVQESKNYGFNFQPLPTVQVFEDSNEVFVPEENRENLYVSLQDEWTISPSLALTLGARYDHFTEFGGSFNPRLAVVHNGSEKLTNKFLYGRAFRAPSISELYAVNPVALGNLDLTPETIDTWEIAQSYQFTDQLHAGLNFYYFEAKDLISYATMGIPIAQNEGKIEGYGGEFEFKYRYNKHWFLMGNYAYQKSEDKINDQDAGNAPSHQIYLRGVWEPNIDYLLSAQVSWIGERKRPVGDSRNELGGYTNLDVKIEKRNLIPKVDGSLVVKNLLDDEIREPASFIPNDLPKAGRSVLVSARYRF